MSKAIWYGVAGGAAVLALGFVVWREHQASKVSTAPGSMVRVPVGAFLNANGTPLLSTIDLAQSQKLDPVGTAAALPQGLSTVWDVLIAEPPAVSAAAMAQQGLLFGASSSPVERKAFPVLFHASAIVGASSAKTLAAAPLPTPAPAART